MHDGAWLENVGDGEWADDDADQDHQHGFLHGPKRRDVGGVEQVFRGKIPGSPG